MGAFSFRRCGEDLLQLLRTHKTKVVLCCVFAVLGIALGVTMYCISNYNWWYYNRNDYACKLLYDGFFAVFLAFLLSAVVCAALLCLFSVWRQTRFLSYVVVFFSGFYLGANASALFTCVGAWALAFVLTLQLFGLAANALCCFLVLADDGCNNTFKQTICQCKPVLIIQFAAVLVKILLIFVLLRPLTALI